jgi:hypothetical protein
MRSFITLGVVSLVGVGAIFACGDDESTDRPGIGGTGGTGGATGGTGGAAAGTGGATGGTAGVATGGTGGTTTTPPPGPLATCTGCVELIVPAVGPNDGDSSGTAVNQADQAIFQFALATPVDFSNAVLTWRVAAVAPNANHSIQLFVQDGTAQNFAGAYYNFALDPVAFPANTFRELSIDISALAAAAGDAGAPLPPPVVDAGADAGDAGAAPGGPTPGITAGFDKSLISSFGVIVGVSTTQQGAAVVRVALDSVSITGVAGQDHTFNAGAEGFALNPYQAPPGTPAVAFHPAP